MSRHVNWGDQRHSEKCPRESPPSPAQAERPTERSPAIGPVNAMLVSPEHPLTGGGARIGDLSGRYGQAVMEAARLGSACKYALSGIAPAAGPKHPLERSNPASLRRCGVRAIANKLLTGQTKIAENNAEEGNVTH